MIIRQLTRTGSTETVYRDMGHITLQLHELALQPSGREVSFQLVDHDDCAEATVRVQVDYIFIPPQRCIDWGALSCCRKKEKELQVDRLSKNREVWMVMGMGMGISMIAR
ncbi:hypothetical protein EON65_56650 [archaeon]|nr:MAG: hypothetical protein EON65_56650 [archaeon]